MRIHLLPVLLGSLISGCSAADRSPETMPPTVVSAPAVRPDFAAHFGDHDGTFVLLDARTGGVTRHDSERAATRFLPASTFKIPNTLIALDAGVASGPDFHLAWDSTAVPRASYWPAVWARDHTLRTALPASVVWFYQELARRIGPRRMQTYVDRFDYGNRDISGGIDTFWLTGGLRISADEQVEFLRRFHSGDLGVSHQTTQLVKELLVVEETDSYRLSGKTGWAALGEADSREIGWFVGYVETDEGASFFAMNIDIRRNDDAAARLTITRAVLRDLGLI